MCATTRMWQSGNKIEAYKNVTLGFGLPGKIWQSHKESFVLSQSGKSWQKKFCNFFLFLGFYFCVRSTTTIRYIGSI